MHASVHRHAGGAQVGLPDIVVAEKDFGVGATKWLITQREVTVETPHPVPAGMTQRRVRLAGATEMTLTFDLKSFQHFGGGAMITISRDAAGVDVLHTLAAGGVGPIVVTGDSVYVQFLSGYNTSFFGFIVSASARLQLEVSTMPWLLDLQVCACARRIGIMDIRITTAAALRRVGCGALCGDAAARTRAVEGGKGGDGLAGVGDGCAGTAPHGGCRGGGDGFGGECVRPAAPPRGGGCRCRRRCRRGRVPGQLCAGCAGTRGDAAAAAVARADRYVADPSRVRRPGGCRRRARMRRAAGARGSACGRARVRALAERHGGPQ